jgi:hypothetical protein
VKAEVPKEIRDGFMTNTKRTPTADRSPIDFMGAVDGWVIMFGRLSIKRLRSHCSKDETSVTLATEKQPTFKEQLYKYI